MVNERQLSASQDRDLSGRELCVGTIRVGICAVVREFCRSTRDGSASGGETVDYAMPKLSLSLEPDVRMEIVESDEAQPHCRDVIQLPVWKAVPVLLMPKDLTMASEPDAVSSFGLSHEAYSYTASSSEEPVS